MADTKISALPASTTPLAGTEVLPIVQSGVTRQVSVANLTAGRAISATQMTLSSGSLIVANGQGVDFSATPGTGTSELFNDYEIGTWAAALSDGTNSVSLGNGTYTKIGRSVFLVLDAYSSSMAGLNTAANLTITGIPFVPVNGSITAWTPSLYVALNSFAINCATNGIIYPVRTSNTVDFNLTPLSVFGSPGTMSWQFTANYSV
jgi:hypothetical protein